MIALKDNEETASEKLHHSTHRSCLAVLTGLTYGVILYICVSRIAERYSLQDWSAKRSFFGNPLILGSVSIASGCIGLIYYLWDRRAKRSVANGMVWCIVALMIGPTLAPPLLFDNDFDLFIYSILGIPFVWGVGLSIRSLWMVDRADDSKNSTRAAASEPMSRGKT